MSELQEIIPRYYEMKSEMESYKKQVDEDNLKIKALMSEEGLSDETCGEYTAHYRVIVTENFDEGKLINRLKLLGKTKSIKMKEYVDMDILEDAIYNGEINASDLKDCKITKTQERLVVKKERK